MDCILNCDLNDPSSICYDGCIGGTSSEGMNIFSALQTCLACTGCPMTCNGDGMFSCAVSPTCDSGGDFCADCVTCVETEHLCETQILACGGDSGCASLQSCLTECETNLYNDGTFDFAGCSADCRVTNAAGETLYDEMNQCIYCDNCPVDCSSSPLPNCAAMPL
jgi:hypothetical protein